MPLYGASRRVPDTRFNMHRNRGTVMEVVVVGMERKDIIEKLRRRGVRVLVVPGSELTIYFLNGFQELVGEEAERYVSHLLEDWTYFVEYY